MTTIQHQVIETTRQVTVPVIVGHRTWTFGHPGSYAPDCEDDRFETLPVDSVTFELSSRQNGPWFLRNIIIRCFRGEALDRQIVIGRVESPGDTMPMWLAIMAVIAAQ